MKATGIVRQLDCMGRFVVPIEIRRVRNINTKDAVEISTDGYCIIIEKYVERCYICEGTNNVQDFKGKHLCEECIKEIINL